MMAESVSDVASVRRSMALALQSSEDNLVSQTRQARELQGDLLRTRMVEFDSLSDRLYRVVRQAAREESKQVSLDIIGGQTEMDRSIIDRIAASFEHLLRNAVVHGIESAQQRTQMGKDPVGHINIHLRQEGGDRQGVEQLVETEPAVVEVRPLAGVDDPAGGVEQAAERHQHANRHLRTQLARQQRRVDDDRVPATKGKRKVVARRRQFEDRARLAARQPDN